ncbi:uncharacterized protein LAESUDRAFT_443286 [Laetiporus sulphureus 93-53]|uniref:HNH nuclease domain-containing protein n=1 Tax=Laetiporus sulphureus 93-53 TaxID=1314785 RepID=A0A165C026_9APHY|nr:uncharacterized protein LAESUDRAFT_443286 [Laetiporus sulphureus 93-53]KZT01958.1 hypothetical protein LAESUDRAFT_443286 [Laetiporus sulphureus 93-53]
MIMFDLLTSLLDTVRTAMLMQLCLRPGVLLMIPATYPGPPPAEALAQTFISDQLEKIEKSPASTKNRNLLKAAIVDAPFLLGKLNNAWAVNDAKPEQLDDLAEYYYTSILVPVRAAGGKTPAPRSHPFRNQFDLTVTPELEKRLSTLKAKALVRDGYKCVVTGKVDQDHVDKVTTWTGFDLDITDAAHIMPFSLNDFEETEVPMMADETAIWTALQAFSGRSLDGLKGDGINSLQNVLTLSASVHRLFCQLVLAFEPMEAEPNVYRILTWGKAKNRRDLSEIVTLSDHSNSGKALPNPVYLSLHAALCKVLHASGRAEELDRILADLNEGETPVLSHDGSTADLLEIALLRAVAVG